jgi:hypothetical protein
MTKGADSDSEVSVTMARDDLIFVLLCICSRRHADGALAGSYVAEVEPVRDG